MPGMPERHGADCKVSVGSQTAADWRKIRLDFLLRRDEVFVHAQYAIVIRLELARGQNNLKQRATCAVRRRRKPSIVTFDDHAANGQSQAHSVCFCREEWVEYIVQAGRINSGP